MGGGGVLVREEGLGGIGLNWIGFRGPCIATWKKWDSAPFNKRKRHLLPKNTCLQCRIYNANTFQSTCAVVLDQQTAMAMCRAWGLEGDETSVRSSF